MTDDMQADGLRAWTHVIYGLHALSVLIGITSPAFIVTAFVFGVPSIVAIILNYVKRAESRGSFLESHFRWQIRTFWFGLLWTAIGLALLVVLVGILILTATAIWVLYRAIKGWIALSEGRPLEA